MFSTIKNMHSIVSDFQLNRMMRYSLFAPRLYNLCKTLGFEPGHIMPSRAFCSDENQGFPIIMIAKHFGTFPFNHGRVGGIVATSRHGPHAHHGKDVVIIQASHVGYDPETESFGSYCRLQTAGNDKTPTCGKISAVLQWYLDEYQFAQKNIFLGMEDNIRTITIDNQLLDEQRDQGLFLSLEKMIKIENQQPVLLKTLSTSKMYAVSDEFDLPLPTSSDKQNQQLNIGNYLTADLFSYRRHIIHDNEGYDHLENNLINPMPWIVTSDSPILVAAQVNTQAEFDRTFRTIAKEKEYLGKRLLFISCLHIDISPREGQIFPLTKCIPWAAFLQSEDGSSRTLEQTEIIDLLMQQSSENPDQIDLEVVIQQMVNAEEISVTF